MAKSRYKGPHEGKAIHEIAKLAFDDWRPMSRDARPYASAMMACARVTDTYGCETAHDMVAYFLANAAGWKGDVAREAKRYLSSLLKE